MYIRFQDPVLVHKVDPQDKFTIVCEESIRENAIEKSRPQPIEIKEELPSLIPAC